MCVYISYIYTYIHITVYILWQFWRMCSSSKYYCGAQEQEMMRFPLDSVVEARWDMSKDFQKCLFCWSIQPLVSQCCSPKIGQQRPAVDFVWSPAASVGDLTIFLASNTQMLPMFGDRSQSLRLSRKAGGFGGDSAQKVLKIQGLYHPWVIPHCLWSWVHRILICHF